MDRGRLKGAYEGDHCHHRHWDDFLLGAQIYLGAIAGLVPSRVVQAIAAFLDFAYIARRSEHDTHSLAAMQEALDQFHELRKIFVELGVRDDFNLPRQHALIHYIQAIEMFGSPNGLCSSITESKHIDAVKRIWRASSRRTPIAEMVRHLARRSKMAAARVEFGRLGMLHGDVLTAVRLDLGADDVEDTQTLREDAFRLAQAACDAQDARDVLDTTASIKLGARDCESPNSPDPDASMLITHIAVIRLNDLADELERPQLRDDVMRFLHGRIYVDGDFEADADDEEFPHISPREKLGRHLSATIVFHAPSELSGPHGMRSEVVRCNPSWYNKYPRFDTILVTTDPDVWGMSRFRVARLRQLISIPHGHTRYEGAFVEWFTTSGDAPDPETGMWLVEPEMDGDVRVCSIVPLDSIARACHLLPKLGNMYLPADFNFADALDAFNVYYANHYIDYHAHETIV